MHRYDAKPRRSLFELTKTTINSWLADHGPRLAAAFSYYAIFSIGPLLIVALTLTGLIFGKRAANDQLRPQIAQFIGDKPAQFVQQLINSIAKSAHFSLFGIITIILILYAATNLFVSLQDSLNSIFGVAPKPGRGIKGILIDRGMSVLMVFIVAVLVLASILLSTALSAFVHNLSSAGALTSFLLQAANFLVSTIIFTAVFALMFKFLPDIKIHWHDTLIGALVTSVLFNIARIALGFYLGYSSTTSAYGAAGSLVVIMLFIYYSSQIFFLGAKFTQVFACRHGDPIEPSKNAVALPQPRDPSYPPEPCAPPPPQPKPQPFTPPATT